PQFLQSLVMSSKYEATGRLAVEPVGQGRPARQAETKRVEIVFEARAAFRPGMHGDAGGRVDDEHQNVAVGQGGAWLLRRRWDIGSPNAPDGIGAAKGEVLSDGDERKGKPGLMRRWFVGAPPAETPASEQSAHEAPGAVRHPVLAAPEPKRTWFE